MTAFDSAHPLWEFTLVEHVDGDGAALVMKLHHSLTDGVGGMQLALELFDPTPDGPTPRADPPPPAPEHLPRGALVRDGLVHDARELYRLASRQARAALPAVLSAARHPVQTRRDLIETVESVGRMVAPVPEILSPVLVERGLTRELDMLTVPLEDLQRAAHAAGGTLNDAFVTAVTGGMRRYHERHDTEVRELRMMMPISIRSATDPVVGNRITLPRFTVPVGEPDAAARLREIAARCRLVRSERSLPYTNAIAGALNLLPHAVTGAMLKRVDFVASNVPGFREPMCLAGAEMTGYFPFGPTAGTALNVILLSYRDTCCVGVTMDAAAVRDPDAWMTSLAEGFDEVLALGGRHRRPVWPLHVRARRREPVRSRRGPANLHRAPAGRDLRHAPARRDDG